ncbi:3,4-dioxygenase subunit beta [Nocardioides sp. HM23]|uniref:dioxygenase family protein n=1 Tax=Nocardioides bizhenqiangii TaxID=3095076 RepID=UPI002ACAC030|nr:3,4-dioxygenase subunit beta [Nocardioides sp. HM23]MDZ5623221.1 3,4-dioxygenase subunit beta [Nocardioides sp. HM23]
MTTDLHDHGDGALEPHDLGLQHDLNELSEQRGRAWGRRGLLGLMGGIGVAAVAGCADDSGTPSGSSSASSSAAVPPAGGPMGDDSGVDVADGEIPEETAGPYPGDGSNGPNVLRESGIVRSDIRASFGTATGVAGGVPTKVRLRVYDLSGDDITPLAGAAIYLWHCDREGRYSMYSEGVTEENYLRGVQEADDDGWLEFTTIFPACYAGRWPHLHFEVYESVAKATTAENKLRTSQLALPKDVCDEVYDNVEGYEQSVTNLSQLTLESDGIFSDGYSLQLAKVTGSVDEGFTATLNVPV